MTGEDIAPIDSPPEAVAVRHDRPVLEVCLVLALSLGQSVVWSLLDLMRKLTEPKRLNEQVTQLNNTYVRERPLLDLAYQVAGMVFPFMPVPLALYLLWLWRGRAGWAGMGFDRRRPLSDLGWGLALTTVIGLPGIGLYIGVRALGLNTTVSPANLEAHWYTFLIYLGLAAMNGALEEIVMIGYLFTRLRAARWSWVWIVTCSALIRGSYHLYQGFGGFIGNTLMGIIFGLFFLKTRRIWPLVGAHFLLDAFVYLGYPWAYQTFPWLR